MKIHKQKKKKKKMSVKCDPTVQTTQKYDILRNHSRYDFGNSCASKRR